MRKFGLNRSTLYGNLSIIYRNLSYKQDILTQLHSFREKSDVKMEVGSCLKIKLNESLEYLCGYTPEQNPKLKCRQHGLLLQGKLQDDANKQWHAEKKLTEFSCI